jgi:4-amino-4-deoxy-L-arabinose transferase-like glycosyltransferase
MARIERSRFLILAGVASLIFAAVNVFWNFQRMGLSHWDEYYYIGTAAWAMNINWGRFQAVEPTLFPFLLSLMFRAFGLYDYVAVATSEVMAILLCALTFWWTQREYDFSTALVSVLVLASTSMFILFAKMALADMTLAFFFSATIFAYATAFRGRSNWAFLVAGFLLAFTMGVKYNGFLSLLVILIFIPFLYLSIFRGKASFKNGNSYFLNVLSSVPKLLLSLVPPLVFALVFIAYLGNPFPPSVVDIMKLFGDHFIIRLMLGWRFLLGLQGWFYVSSSSLRPLYSAEFYGNVLLEFVGLFAILLSIVGIVCGLVKRQVNTILLVIWMGLVFIFFSSIANKYPRVMLPLIVPLSILAAQGILSCAAAITRFVHASVFRVTRKKWFNPSVRVALVILVVILQVSASIPAVTNAHSGYREAAEFLAATVPNRVIFYRCQPVLLVYTNNLGLGSQTTAGIAMLNYSSAVVLDFIATLSPDYSQIQARISHMTLSARINNDILINMLDSTKFDGLREWKSDPDHMSIRIYLENLTKPHSSMSSSVYALSSLLQLRPQFLNTSPRVELSAQEVNGDVVLWNALNQTMVGSNIRHCTRCRVGN